MTKIFLTGALIVNKEENKILLVKNKDWGENWALPEVKNTEKLLSSKEVMAELNEMLGISLQLEYELSPSQVANTVHFIDPNAKIEYKDYIFYTNSTEKISSDKITKSVWVKPYAAVKMGVADRFAPTILEYLDRIGDI